MPTLQTGKKETFLADLHTEIQNRTGLTTQSFLPLLVALCSWLLKLSFFI